MAVTVAIKQIRIIDTTGSGPVRCLVEADVVSDDPQAVATGANTKRDVRWAYMTRATYNALIGALHRPSATTAPLAGVTAGDDWPDGVVAHPIAKDP